MGQPGADTRRNSSPMPEIKRRLVRCPARPEALATLLVLAACVTFRSWVEVTGRNSRRLGRSRADVVPWRGSASCEWDEQTGDILYRLTHRKDQAKGAHWFHIAESFTSSRADLEASNSIRGGNRTVYLQALDGKWMASLTPMTRLLVTAGLTSTSGNDIHFVDLDQASFCFPDSGDLGQSSYQSLRGRTSKDTDARANVPLNPCPPDSRNRNPSDGQVGWLRYDYPGRGSEFVVSPDQPLSERFTRSAAENPVRTDGKILVEPVDEELRAGETISSPGDMAETRGVCVKSMTTIGKVSRERAHWFPSVENALSLRLAIDAFCPISWLREGADEAGGGDGTGVSASRSRDTAIGRDLPGGRGGSCSDGCVPGTMSKRLLIYQRDRNRKIIDMSGVVGALEEMLGPHGWTIQTMIHSDERHPCELVRTLAGVDVLVTAHGFQSMLAVFMRPGSLLFEIFPRKYFKAGYQPMVTGLAIRHGYTRSRPHMPLSGFEWPSEETCMKHFWCRSYARRSNVDLSKEDLATLVGLALETQPCGST